MKSAHGCSENSVELVAQLASSTCRAGGPPKGLEVLICKGDRCIRAFVTPVTPLLDCEVVCIVQAQFETQVVVAKELETEAESLLQWAKDLINYKSVGTTDQVAAISMYTMQTMHCVVNAALNDPERTQDSLQPLLPYLKLLLGALRGLPHEYRYTGLVCPPPPQPPTQKKPGRHERAAAENT